MKEILILIIICGIFFITFLITLILGLVQSKKTTILIGVVLFVCLVVALSYTGYKIVATSYHKITDVFKPRSGEEIYKALFDKPRQACLKIIHYQDQIIPKIDYAIWIHFRTCPAELNRILSKHKFEKEITSTLGMHSSGPLANNNWFKPELLGDSILIYVYRENDFGKGQTIFSNLSQTEAYCKDSSE